MVKKEYLKQHSLGWDIYWLPELKYFSVYDLRNSCSYEPFKNGKACEEFIEKTIVERKYQKQEKVKYSLNSELTYLLSKKWYSEI